MDQKISTDSAPKIQEDVISFGIILKLLIVLFIILVLTMAVTWKVTTKEEQKAFVVPFKAGQVDSFSIGQAPASASGPRLQVDEHYDIEAYRKKEFHKLNSYGWVDKQKGIVHIPIEQAMEKTLQELPTRK